MFSFILPLLSALLPVVIVMFYIIRKDKDRPEPTRLLLKGVWFGVLSVFVSLFISGPLGILGFYSENPTTVMEHVAVAFWGAAVPEELAKLLMLWLLVRKNVHFDEFFDGIVYAVCVGMGFAGLENIMYVFDNFDSWKTVAFTRFLFAVPGHFCDAVLMGYYFSLAYFDMSPVMQIRYYCWMILAPILAHGFYDAFLMVSEVNETTAVIGIILFLFTVYFLQRLARRKVREHLQLDRDLGVTVSYADAHSASVGSRGEGADAEDIVLDVVEPEKSECLYGNQEAKSRIRDSRYGASWGQGYEKSETGKPQQQDLSVMPVIRSILGVLAVGFLLFISFLLIMSLIIE